MHARAVIDGVERRTMNDGSVLHPGEDIRVHVDIDTSNMASATFIGSVSLKYDHERNVGASYSIDAVDWCEVVPNRVDLGEVLSGECATGSVVVQSTDGSFIRFVGMESDENAEVAIHGDGEEISTATTLRLRSSRRLNPGRHAGATCVTLERLDRGVTGRSTSVVIHLHYSFRVASRFAIEPNSLSLGFIHPGVSRISVSIQSLVDPFPSNFPTAEVRRGGGSEKLAEAQMEHLIRYPDGRGASIELSIPCTRRDNQSLGLSRMLLVIRTGINLEPEIRVPFSYAAPVGD